jgi:HD-GYP domain-containing protein (c-di-GMP phosphodiesterase class II)
MRACWIGMHVGRQLGLPEPELWELYYVLLLKDLGCSSNAARICELYATDDLSFKRDFKQVDDSLHSVLKFVVGHTGLQSGPAERLKALLAVFRTGGEIGRELIQTRCTRGADIARQLRFSEAVADGIRNLDEHWDGKGKPVGVHGETIPLYARIALAAQVADVFHHGSGPEAALSELRRRAGTWFDPAVVVALERAAAAPGFWSGLSSPTLGADLLALEPARHAVLLDDDYLDDIASAFGQVVDAKSPYTSGHSGRVAAYAEALAAELSVAPERRRWLHRAALLHDIGKLGVSNAILDKPGRLGGEEWAVMQAHAAKTHDILSRIAAFDELARVSAAHHERLDGAGYPLGLKAQQISLETRIITVCDVFDALTADRPYRAAMPLATAFSIMDEMAGAALDPACLAALKRVTERDTATRAA